MREPLEFYTQQLKVYEKEKKKVSKQIAVSSTLRLIVFLGIIAIIYFFFGNFRIIFPSIVVLLAIFLYLISRHSDLKTQKNKLEELIKRNTLEIKILTTRDFSELPEGKSFDIEGHEYSRDIDLFGKKSFFQYLNRTALKEGTNRLATILLANSTENIAAKQHAIKELAAKPKWRQEFTATAKLVNTETSSGEILKFLKNYRNFVSSKIGWLPVAFSLVSILVILSYYFNLVPGAVVLYWFILGVMISGFYFKRVNELSGNISKSEGTFQQYHHLLNFLETEEFHSEILKALKDTIKTRDQKASQSLRKFSKAIDALDQRNNLLFGIFANGFFLWDLFQTNRIEKWIAANSEAVEHWFEAVEKIDAYNSLGNFAFNHQHYTFPEITAQKNGISATALGHPLLHPGKRINNDFRIQNEEFFIITGANMAGKSTFLRTVALQIVMANIGLPVCAESCSYTPIKLITSMRTSDSLGDDESYFFSELKRLKYIVEKIETDDYFIILDEILKGTNSTDKAIGSRKFVQRLVASNSTGLIATHDLSLCEVSDELPEVKNYYFDAEIIDNELHFDYKFKDGICQNMNASFLLRKMNIVTE